MPNKPYVLPPEVGVGLTTGRTEFISILEKQILQNGRVVPREQIVDLLRLVKDMIAQRARDHEHLRALEKFIDSMDDFNKGIFSKISDMRQAIDGIRRDDAESEEA